MAHDGFDVELDDLTTFFDTVQRAGEEFRDGGFQTLTAMGQFATASGLAAAGLQSLASASGQQMTGWESATTALQEGALGLSTLALGAHAIRASYTSADGQGASVLGRIDGGVVDKMFAPPKEQEQGGAGASGEAATDAQQDLLDRLEATQDENKNALEEGVDALNGGPNSYLDSYDGSTVVEVPGVGEQPDQRYESPREDELGPDLPEIDKYNEEARQEDLRRIEIPKPGTFS